MKNIVIFNGGRGASNLINTLKDKKNLAHIYSIVNAYDDGKSTGNLRSIFDILGPSDIRKVQELFLPKDNNFLHISKLFSFRFNKKFNKNEFFSILNIYLTTDTSDLFGIKLDDITINDFIKTNLKYFSDYMNADYNNIKKFNLDDMSLINCVYAGSIINNKNHISKSIKEFDKIFKLEGSVICVSDDIKHLVALENNGKVYYSESEIVEKRSNSDINKIFLLDEKINKNDLDHMDTVSKLNFLKNRHNSPSISSKIEKIIASANVIIYAPGTQHSSLYPTYLHKGLGSSIVNNKIAEKYFITNIGADYETPNYDTYDYLIGAYNYLNNDSREKISINDLFDHVLINYNQGDTKSSYVKHNINKFKNLNLNLIVDNLESPDYLGRHNGNKIFDIIFKN